MSQIPHKIVLKSTTKISLNERFSSIRPSNTPSVQQVRVNMAAAQQATAKNRRLAQQMANRPTVQAALRLKKKSLKQRLGTNVRSRLSFASNGQQMAPPQMPQGRRGMRGRGRGLTRGVDMYGSQLSINSMASNVSGRSRGRGYQARGQPGGRGHVVYQSRGRGMGRGARRGQPGAARSFRGAARGGRGRGVQQGMAGFVQRGRGGGRGSYGSQTRGAAGRGVRRGGRGRGRGRGRGSQPSVTREQLDKQIDEYMCTTKTEVDDFI